MSPIASAPARIASKCAVALVGRVEVEHDPVRAVGLVGAGRPHVRGDAVLVGEPDERRRLAADHLGDLAALAARHGHRPHPVRRALRDRLLDHDVLVDPVVPAPQVQRAVARVLDHRRRDRRVVLRQIELGDPVVREQDLVRMGDPHAAAPCPDFGVGHLQRLTDDGPLGGPGLVEPADRACRTARSAPPTGPPPPHAGSQRRPRRTRRASRASRSRSARSAAPRRRAAGSRPSAGGSRGRAAAWRGRASGCPAPSSSGRR